MAPRTREVTYQLGCQGHMVGTSLAGAITRGAGLVSHNGSWPEKWMAGEGKPPTTWQQLVMAQVQRVAQNHHCVVNKHIAKYSEVNGEACIRWTKGDVTTTAQLAAVVNAFKTALQQCYGYVPAPEAQHRLLLSRCREKGKRLGGVGRK
ncbi:uncharacterized [Tachysurus ichikawai]